MFVRLVYRPSQYKSKILQELFECTAADKAQNCLSLLLLTEEMEASNDKLTALWEQRKTDRGKLPGMVLITEADFAILGKGVPRCCPDSSLDCYAELHYCAPCLSEDDRESLATAAESLAERFGVPRPLIDDNGRVRGPNPTTTGRVCWI